MGAGLVQLAAAGFTRVSFGMQSAVPHVLATLDRTHDPARLPDVVAWAHGTTGVARQCAPSLYPAALRWIPGLANAIGRGYVVAATDYPGLGTVGVHPYLIGESEGRAVLDSVRAARHLDGAGANEHFAVWGHSQGGHAVLFAGALAPRYAPELRLAGVAAAAASAATASPGNSGPPGWARLR